MIRAAALLGAAAPGFAVAADAADLAPDGAGLLRATLGLALVLALIFAVGWVMRRLQPATRRRARPAAHRRHAGGRHARARRRCSRSASSGWSSASHPAARGGLATLPRGELPPARRRSPPSLVAGARRCPLRASPHAGGDAADADAVERLRARIARPAPGSPRRLAVVALVVARCRRTRSERLPLVSSVPAPAGAGGKTYSLPVQTLLFLTALAFLPAVLLLMTGFTRIVIVLSLLRHALGTQASPPNQVIIGLSLFLTLFVMAPVARPHLRRRLPALHAASD